MASNKHIIEATSIPRKEFTYTKGNVSLNFTLRTDTKSELKAFKELMERGISDIDTELALIDSKK